METGNFLVEFLRQGVNLGLVVLVVGEQLNLCQRLVGKRCRHHETWVSCRTAEVQQTSFSQNQHAVTVRERPLVILRLDVFLLDAWNFSQFSHLDFVVEGTDVAHNCHIFHLAHVFGSNDIAVASGRNIYVTVFQSVFNRKHLVTFH